MRECAIDASRVDPELPVTNPSCQLLVVFLLRSRLLFGGFFALAMDGGAVSKGGR